MELVNIESYVDELVREAMKSDSESEPEGEPELEAVLKGRAIELWSDARGERFWLVADEEDAKRLGEPRGIIYTAAEARRVVQIGDAAVVSEIHNWKRRFEGVIRGRWKRAEATHPEGEPLK